MKLPLDFQAVVLARQGGEDGPGGLFCFVNIGFYGIHNSPTKIRSLKRSGMVQLLYFIGGKLRPREKGK